MPGLPVGHFETRPGPFMAAEDVFEISLRGQGGHASRPDWGREVMVPACALVLELQTIVARRPDPADTAVLSVTELVTDGTRNALPGEAHVRGDCRSFQPEVSARIEQEMRRIAEGIAVTHDVAVDVAYRREFVPTTNDAALAAEMTVAAEPVSKAVAQRAAPMTASEDFAQFQTLVPGCFAFIGNGENCPPLHSPDYDFDDNALIHGAQIHVAVAQRRLAEA